MIKYKTIRTQLAWPNSRQIRALRRAILMYGEEQVEDLTKKLAKSVLPQSLKATGRAASKL